MAAVCLMDAGRNGVMILADHVLPRARPVAPRRHRGPTAGGW